MRPSFGTKPRLPQARSVCNNENGAALIIGLVFLAILAMLGTTAVVMTSTDLQIGGNYRSNTQSYYAAEAGLQAVINRLSLGSGDTNYIGEIGTGPTPGWGRYVVLQTGTDTYKEDPNWDLSSDSLDNDSDSTTDESNETYPEIATVQTIDGNELDYLVKAHYKIEDAQFNNGADNDEVVLYGQDFGYGAEAPVLGTHPVWVVTTIGSSANNSAKTSITAEVARFPLDIDAKAALACDASPSLGGNTLVSGFNHDLTTASGDDARSATDITFADLTLDGNGSDNHGGKENWLVSGNTNDSLDSLAAGEGEDTAVTNPRLDEVTIKYGAKIENDQSTYLPGVWTTGDTVVQSGTDDIYGGNNSDAWKDEDGGNVWLTLAQLLGITDAQLQKVLDRADVTMADTSVSGGNLFLNVAPVGVTYIDNAASGALKFSSGTTGSGLMYITGNLNANNLTFKGLIYVEGTISLAGGFWLLGAMATKGGNPGASGGGEILYSKDALDYEVGNAMKFVALSVGDESLLP